MTSNLSPYFTAVAERAADVAAEAVAQTVRECNSEAAKPFNVKVAAMAAADKARQSVLAAATAEIESQLTAIRAL